MAGHEVHTDRDVIVVGARCAGAPTAMLLARQGHRVLLVDRASFPSDTLSTHMIHAPGVAALQRWGLLEQVVATGCPPIDRYSFDFGPFAISGAPRPTAGVGPTAYAPRRTVLDKILVDAAAAAGAEVRERFTVEGIEVEGDRVVGIRGHGPDGATVVERARVVVGADGRSSHVARAVRPDTYLEKPELQWSYYSYWSDLPVDGMEIFIRPDRGWAALPHQRRSDPARGRVALRRGIGLQGGRGGQLPRHPGAGAGVRRARARRHQARTGSTAVPSPTSSASPSGPGGSSSATLATTRTRSPHRASATRSATPSTAPPRSTSGCTTARSFDAVMGAYQQQRDDAVLPLYEFTTQLATLEPPPPEMQQLLGAVHGNQDAMDGFVGITTGTVSPVDFFDPENIGRIMGAAAAVG